VILEPGRSLTGATQLLLATVRDVKTDGALAHAVLDAGINVAASAANEFHQLFSATAPTAEPTTSYRIVGPICTPADVLYNNWRLPPLEPGHVLAIMDTGAYFIPFSTSFSFPRPPVVIQDGLDVRVARKRETFDDMTALDGLGPDVTPTPRP
jgi:diaminopimelate decarboxylase